MNKYLSNGHLDLTLQSVIGISLKKKNTQGLSKVEENIEFVCFFKYVRFLCVLKFNLLKCKFWQADLASLSRCTLFLACYFRKKSKDIPKKYIKAVYREYMDGTYTVLKPRPAWTGKSSLLMPSTHSWVCLNGCLIRASKLTVGRL